MGSLIVIVFVVCVVLPALCVTLVLQNSPKRRRERQAARWREWEWLQQRRAMTPGAEFAEVVHVYQRAQRGTKAVIQWLGTGVRQDAWFEAGRPVRNSVVLITGRSGWGPHNQDPNVFYVTPQDVHGVLSAATRKALQQQHGRAA